MNMDIVFEKNEVERQTYEAIKKSVSFSYDEFMKMRDTERAEWVDACRLARLLNEEKGETLYEGYHHTSMFDEEGNFDLGNATSIVFGKKRALGVIEKYTDIDLTPAQFVLLGENKTQEIINSGLKIINLETAKTLDEGRLGEAERIKTEAESLVEEKVRQYAVGSSKKSSEVSEGTKTAYWK